MANMVHNSLFVFGQKKDLKRFHKVFSSKNDMFNYPFRSLGKEREEKEKQEIKRIKEDKNVQFFSFNNIISVPKEIRKLEFDEHGYRWQVENWSTKWDCFQIYCQIDPDYKEIVYNFTTAWSPPENVIKIMSLIFPKCLFWLVFSEEDVFSGEILRCKRLQIEEVTQFNASLYDEKEGNPLNDSWCDVFIGTNIDEDVLSEKERIKLEEIGKKRKEKIMSFVKKLLSD